MTRSALFAITVFVCAVNAQAASLAICNGTDRDARVLLTRADGTYAPPTPDKLPPNICLEIVDTWRGTYFVDFFTDAHCHERVVVGDEAKLDFDERKMRACKRRERLR